MRANPKIRAFLYSLVLYLVSLSNSAGAPADWLMKINKAAAEVNFAGTFIYVHAGQVEAMDIARRVDSGGMQERLYALNGEAREVIRDRNRVWCYIPDQNVGVHDYRQMSESGFPRILPGDFAELSKNYQFLDGQDARIAGRIAHQINVVPNDNYRYGYALWADTESGLLLRSDLVDREQKIIEQYMFVNIDIDGEISDEQLAAVSNKDQLEWFGNSKPPISTPADSSDWLINQVPQGYRLSKRIRRMSPTEAGEVEHLVYTDGLSTLSVFIKEAREGQSGMKGLSRMGAVNAYRDTINNHRVTVMGEVPARTVEFVAGGITYRQ